MLSFIFSTIFLDILKIRSINTAQNDAAIPTNAIILSPANGLLKSISVMLKISNATAKSTKMLVKIFIGFMFLYCLNVIGLFQYQKI
jgi:hypothetical protein